MAMLGCLPLIFQPFVMQPLEDLLMSYPNFSLRVDRLQLASDLPALLAAVGPGQVSAMRVALRTAGQALSWAPGGLAFVYTIAALCFRAIELHGSLKSGGAECAPRGLPVEPRPQPPSWFPPAVLEATVVLRRERAAAMRELRARASMRAAPREVAQLRTPRPEDLTEVAVLAFPCSLQQARDEASAASPPTVAVVAGTVPARWASSSGQAPRVGAGHGGGTPSQLAGLHCRLP